jgi:hypothetical protein
MMPAVRKWKLVRAKISDRLGYLPQDHGRITDKTICVPYK